MNRTRIGVCLALALAGIAGGHIYEVIEGVHFKGSAPADFGRPPSREELYLTLGDGMDAYRRPWRPGTVYLLADSTEDAYTGRVEAMQAENKILRDRARRLESAGKFEPALAMYRSMDQKGQGEAGFIRERIEVLSDGLAAGDRSGLAAYLAGRKPTSRWLLPFYRYDLISATPASRERGMSFAHLAEEAGGSPWTEPIAMMAARDLLKNPGHSGELLDSQGSADVGKATRLLKLILRNRTSRFTASAVGWLARADFLRQEYRGALAKYWIQLGMGIRGRQRLNLLDSMHQCEIKLQRHGRAAYVSFLVLDFETDPDIRAYWLTQVEQELGRFSVADAKDLWACLRKSPRALSAYLDYRLDRTRPSKDMLELVGDADITGTFRGHILADLAQAAYILNGLDQTLRYCRLCLGAATQAPDLALATYLNASVAQRRGQRALAILGYNAVLSRYRKTYLGMAARENLALLYERTGRFGGALDMYYALGYEEDVAYMLDVRMSTGQIAAYLRTHPKHPSRDVIRFSLGLRYLRVHQFDQAKDEFTRVPGWKRKLYVKQPSWGDGDPSLRDPLITARDLEARYAAVEGAHTQEAKARALLSIANYYYTRRDLLLYNPRLWQFQRADDIAWSWNSTVATHADDVALREHHQEHECLAQALDAFRELLRKYPRSSVAQKAAYRAACAAWRLSDFSPYWRWVADRENLREESVHLMDQASKGPNAALAKAARKFAGVFREQDQFHRDDYKDIYSKGHPPARWTTGW